MVVSDEDDIWVDDSIVGVADGGNEEWSGSVDCGRACRIAPERVDEARRRLTGLHLVSFTCSSISLPTK